MIGDYNKKIIMVLLLLFFSFLIHLHDTENKQD
jgi:hypothetical protein